MDEWVIALILLLIIILPVIGYFIYKKIKGEPKEPDPVPKPLKPLKPTPAPPGPSPPGPSPPGPSPPGPSPPGPSPNCKSPIFKINDSSFEEETESLLIFVEPSVKSLMSDEIKIEGFEKPFKIEVSVSINFLVIKDPLPTMLQDGALRGKTFEFSNIKYPSEKIFVSNISSTGRTFSFVPIYKNNSLLVSPQNYFLTGRLFNNSLIVGGIMNGKVLTIDNQDGKLNNGDEIIFC